MRTLLLASAAMLALGGSAFAQNATGNPRSTTASNITGANTHSNLAPALPAPGVDMSPEQLLMRASQDVKAGRTGAAQEALEEAETRLLDRSTAPSAAGMPDSRPRVAAIRKALDALAGGDRHGAMQGIQMAMMHPAMQGGGGMPMASGAGMDTDGAPPMAPAASMPPMPMPMADSPMTGSASPANGIAQQKMMTPPGAPATPMGQ